MIDRRFSVAPMMDWTDRHDRYFLRLISQHALLYTEMVTTGALIHADTHRFLHFDASEHPLALQLGGSDPEDLALCAKMGEDYGYDEINLNVGCPSDRVQNGRFGACLMAEPELVGACIAAMQQAVSIPVTVKCRIGIDDQDSEADFDHFIHTVSNAGCQVFIVHARKAWLKGLSPKENRSIPPLDYDRVVRLKARYPHLTIVLNGGLETLDQAEPFLDVLDGVMLGRAAYHNPYLLSEVDHRIFGDDRTALTRHEVAAAIVPYAARRMPEGVPLKSITRHLMGLFNGCPNARAWRRMLSENARSPQATPELIVQAAALAGAEPIERAIKGA